MKVKQKVLILAAISSVQLSCGSVGSVVTMTGEMATLHFHDGRVQSAELLAVEDSSIFCIVAPDNGSQPAARVEEIRVGSISLIEVEGFRNDDWMVGVLLSQVLPAIGLAGAAGSAHADAGTVFAVAMIPAVLTTILYATSGVPTPTFEDPITNEDLLELRKYARFGGRLTPAQKAELLRVTGQ